MRLDSRIEATRKNAFKDGSHDARLRLWKSMIEDFELTWLKDAPSSAATRIIEMTLQKMRENRAREEGWRLFFSERVGA